MTISIRVIYNYISLYHLLSKTNYLDKKKYWQNKVLLLVVEWDTLSPCFKANISNSNWNSQSSVELWWAIWRVKVTCFNAVSQGNRETADGWSFSQRITSTTRPLLDWEVDEILWFACYHAAVRPGKRKTASRWLLAAHTQPTCPVQQTIFYCGRQHFYFTSISPVVQ